jgi:predicted DNA-binding protein YlxM (UPF0122 family)
MNYSSFMNKSRSSGVRSLAELAKTASTSRVLNLNAVDYASLRASDKLHAPFFQDLRLNQSIITKHRPRPDETEYFDTAVAVATKIIFPIDGADLRLGGRSVFVNQIGYLNAMQEFLGKDAIALDQDLQILELLDALPSLDPFLVKEELKRNSFFPSDDYFAITPYDALRLEKFAYGEIRALVTLAVSGGQAYGTTASTELVKKMSNAILATNADHRLAPLQATLGLEGEQFQRGIFSWKGFLYYKWQLTEKQAEMTRVTRQMLLMKIRSRIDAATQKRITEVKAVIRDRVHDSLKRVRQIMSLYDEGLAGLTKNGNAGEFRNFLLEAPNLFIELGHAMGVISHIVSYWQHQFKPTQTEIVNVDEFLELLKEFELGLAPRDFEWE